MTRNIKRLGLVAAICAAVAIGQSVKSLIAVEESSTTLKPVEMLLSKDEAVRNKGQQEILKVRADLVAQLSMIIVDHTNQTSEPRPVEKVIDVLGELRAPESVDVLVEHIGFPFVAYPKKVDSGRRAIERIDSRMGKSLEDYLPAIRALVKIGAPCILPVAKKLATTTNRNEFEACEAVLVSLRDPTGSELHGALDWAYKNAADNNRRIELSWTRRQLGLEPVPEGFKAPNTDKR